MIDYSNSDPKNKFELIGSCILKVMIFIIYRNFSGIYMNLFRFLKGLN